MSFLRYYASWTRSIFRPCAARGFRIVLLCVAAWIGIGASEVRATSLRLVRTVRTQQADALTPRARNFKMCFRADDSGAPVLGLCLDEGKREPAHSPEARGSRRSHPEGRSKGRRVPSDLRKR